MKKMKFKGIVGGILLAFLMVFCVFSCSVVFAVDDTEEENPRDGLPTCNVPSESWGKNMDDLSKYGFSINGGEGATVDISMKPCSSVRETQRKLREAEFNVSVNGISTGKTVKYGSPLTINTSFVNNEMVIDFVTVDSYKDPDCNGNVRIEYIIEYGGKAFNTPENVGNVGDGLDGSESTAIKCVEPYELLPPFERDFCFARDKAMENARYSKENDDVRVNFDGMFNNGYKFVDVVGKRANGELEFSTFKCNHQDVYTSEQLKNNYYVNTQYLYGSGERKLTSKEHYTYHYSPGTREEGATPSCKVKCEEAVVVEYGPPIASKAGLCFEYKIKVTSRVSCNMLEKPGPYKLISEYCTPTPWCTNARGTYTVNQGGPNEEFDSCIKSCDGGKYTDKCSQKCYKKVYGNSSGNASKVSASRGYKIEKLADKVETTINTSKEACAAESSYGGCYYKEGNTIMWYGVKENKNNFFTNPSDQYVPGRWYKTGGWSPGAGKGAYAVFQDDGFKRHIYGGGEYCHDSCWWSGCSGDIYLNPGQAIIDKEENEDIYKRIVQQCTAAVSCNTSTAEFTIAVDYIHDTKDENDKKTTITFPYSTVPDKLTSKGEGKENVVNLNPETKADSTILSYAGCYDSGEAKNLYQTEWSFPGSWINNKTGEVSYKDKSGDGAWKTMKNKFCIPLDAEDVNRNWWNYYYSNPKILNLEHTAIKSDAYKDKCDANYSSSVGSASVDEWNITGKAVRFGYFDWNLEFKCFYALNTNPSNKETKYCINKESNYRIRSVDLKNMFPATDGSELNNFGDFGRTPGFNWTDYADNKKNSSYSSYPSKYMEQVQTKGYSIYSDSSLDYEFELTPEILRKMRQTTKKNNANYTVFSGKAEVEDDGVVHYRSEAIRDGAGLNIAKKKVPEGPGRLCNNMVNYASNQCMSYD